MSVVPSGWSETTLETVVEIMDSQRIPLNAEERQHRISGKASNLLFPYFGATGQVGVIDGYLFDGDHVLLGEDGVPFFDPLRHKAYRAQGKFWVNNHAHVLRAVEGLSDFRFIEAYLNAVDYKGHITGSTRLKLTQAAMRSIPVRLPPLNEQTRIADKLDAVLARIDACRDRLDRIPAILKRFRQSVLAAATSGKLTEEWRAERAADVEPQHESASVACDSGRLACRVTSRCPDGWRDVRLADIADVQGGVTKDAKKQSSEDEEVLYLRVANVQRGYLDLGEIKSIRVPAGRLAGLLLESGDILFNEGGDIDKVGRGWIWEGQIERCSFQNHVFRARLYDKTNQPKYISWWGNFRGLDYFLRSGKQTTNLASINKSMLSNLPISLPPPEEQTEIVRRVEALLAYADRLEARYAAARARVDKLTPATLAKAFRGELVPQDPNDETASALLARIAAARASAAPTRRPRTKSPARKEPFPS